MTLLESICLLALLTVPCNQLSEVNMKLSVSSKVNKLNVIREPSVTRLP